VRGQRDPIGSPSWNRRYDVDEPRLSDRRFDVEGLFPDRDSGRLQLRNDVFAALGKGHGTGRPRAERNLPTQVLVSAAAVEGRRRSLLSRGIGFGRAGLGNGRRRAVTRVRGTTEEGRGEQRGAKYRATAHSGPFHRCYFLFSIGT
jgi:hypothetical protein